jgi:molybdenum cofactor synthesis domain-containing protein
MLAFPYVVIIYDEFGDTMSEINKTLVTAALVIIGNEVLSGRTQDANLKFLGTELNEIGIRMTETRIVPDTEAEIIDAINAMREKFDYVFTTGGIGPTHDDITSACVAKAFGLGHGRHPEAEAILLAYYKPEDVTPARMKMSETPHGAELLLNPVSKAPGFRVENVYVLPGVPHIMREIFSGFKHYLIGGEPVQSKSITAYIPEGRTGGPLSDLQDRFPDVEIGSYPFNRDNKYGAAIVMRHTDMERIEIVAEAVRKLVRDLGSEPHDD